MILPRVSVIVIFYQAERFLREAIDSVLGQSYSSWELLLVDDGSSDGSVAIAADAVRLAPDRIRVLQHEGGANRGMGASRNLGIRNARGEFIAFLDSDDVWMREKLADQIEVLDREPDAALVYGRTRIWRSWEPGDAAARSDFYYELGVEPGRRYDPPRLFNLLIRNRHQSPTTCNAIVRRSLIERIGGFEDAFRGMFEDQAFFAKALLAAPAFVDGRVWALYRQHPASCSAAVAGTPEEREARRRYLRWVGRQLAASPHAPLSAHVALARAVWESRVERVRDQLRRQLPARGRS
jgi:glycosyltransferase involved in cell wall biosynthesis